MMRLPGDAQSDPGTPNTIPVLISSVSPAPPNLPSHLLTVIAGMNGRLVSISTPLTKYNDCDRPREQSNEKTRAGCWHAGVSTYEYNIRNRREERKLWIRLCTSLPTMG